MRHIITGPILTEDGRYVRLIHNGYNLGRLGEYAFVSGTPTNDVVIQGDTFFRVDTDKYFHTYPDVDPSELDFERDDEPADEPDYAPELI
jgi:hypothetical protein